MEYKVSTRILGDRSVFGYTGAGTGSFHGSCPSVDAIDLLNNDFDDYDWRYVRWNGDELIVEFERRNGPNQIIETVELMPTVYAEFLVLKKWEKDNGFV